jgi:membrane protein
MADRLRGKLEALTDLSGKAWVASFKRAAKEFKRRNMTDAAAALTYYGVLAIFPTLLALVALLGVFGQYPATVDAVMQMVRQVAPPATVNTLHSTLEGIVRDKGGAGALLGLGALGALWSSSSYIGAFARACNRIYCIEEGRPTIRLRANQLAIATAMVATMAFVSIAYLFTGKLARAAGSVLGVSGPTVTVWQIAKWPAMALIAAVMLSVLYYASPNVRQARFRWITPGGAFALGTLVVTSTGFAFYVSNFGSYNKTYGALGGVIVMLVWLWIANVTLLLGVQLNAELERSRRERLGQQVEHPPFVEPKDTRKMARA